MSELSVTVPPPPLSDLACVLDGAGCASDYAAHLLGLLGASVTRRPVRDDAHPALIWAASGAMALTGRADGPPRMCPAPLAACVEGVRTAFAALDGANRSIASLPGSATLGERAALSGLHRNGAISPGGACRLLRTGDGWLAVNLPRTDDWQLLPAWLEQEGAATWDALAARLAAHPLSTAALTERGRLIGLAVAAVTDAAAVATAPPWRIAAYPPSIRQENRPVAPLVVDLSSLWAGPLCGHLLHLAGARVVKVESLQRPDGARQGPSAFHDLLNHGKASVALDFSTAQGIGQLRALIERADIVIEASRPRALRQLGIVAEDLVAATPGLTWISIGGYGRDEPQAGWIAYGDDAAVAAGLSSLLCDADGAPLFCGDAIADPLTGWHAALAALAGFRGGGGRLISLALCDVVSHCLHVDLPVSPEEIHRRRIAWDRLVAGAVHPPCARAVVGAARPLGADTAATLAMLNRPC